MPNNYFQFKKFRIIQDRTAMKVGTDAVLLGAWLDVTDAYKVLDIGTGTGLIALMIAQRSENSKIYAVEIDADAYMQACDNVKKSNWYDRVSVIHSSIQDFSMSQQQKYDLIVSNPPFFSNVSNPKDIKRTNARHNTNLSFEDLILCIKELITDKGRFCVVLPVEEGERFIELSKEKELYCSKITYVKPTIVKESKRILMEFTYKKQVKPKKSTIIIEKEKRHDYTKEYKELTKDFYLDF